MPSWWKSGEVYKFVGLLDKTLETVGSTPEFKALLAEWGAVLEGLLGEVRVEVREDNG